MVIAGINAGANLEMMYSIRVSVAAATEGGFWDCRRLHSRWPIMNQSITKPVRRWRPCWLNIYRFHRSPPIQL